MQSITIKKAKCIKPATGIDTSATAFIDDFTVWAGAIFAGAGGTATGVGVAATAGSTTAVTAGAAGVGIAIIGTGLATSALGGWIAKRIDKNRAPDELYILVNNNKVWPKGDLDPGKKGGNRKMKGDDEVDVNYTFPAENQLYKMTPPMFRKMAEKVLNTTLTPTSHLISLREYDWGSKDDPLGSFVFHAKETGIFTIMVKSESEDSEYAIEIEVS